MLLIKEIRKLKGLTQKEVSEKSGISLRSWNAYENNKSSPTAETMKIIAHALDVNVQDLFKRDENSNTIIEEENHIKKTSSNDILLNMIKENAETIAGKDNEISHLEKEIEELKAKVNEELKKQGYDPLD